ncbi:hypothetical protein ZIOFF_031712 [Zingiber officinale]|uniref:Retrotransposon gag domain-containing protein n=1 Tax=Zingiber officinale TaxID=94328 RepID=A0A8J5L0I9_ZINOF|nr:hypothetical protein ZIOFF_031712 [Zingiber officinale]
MTIDFSLFVFFEPAATTDFSHFAFFIDGDKLLLLRLLQIDGDNKLLNLGPLESLAASFSISVGVQLQEDLTLGMDKRTLAKLCYLLTARGQLQGIRNMSISEFIIYFLHIIAYNVENRVLKRQTSRSGETVSRQFHLVFNSILRLHTILLEKLKPIPENHTDERWKWFKDCLGSLDGTYINVKVPADDKPRYRTRKGEIATNVLGVCTPNMQFSYVLPTWERSAADGRVLRDAISRRNGLKIPQEGKSQKSLKGVATAKDVPTSQPVLLSPSELVESSMPMKVKRKTHSTKHLWTKQEDAALVDCLVKLSKDLAWKSENGFRTGYLLHLEKLMAAKVSSSNLKATPHIKSSDVEKCITASKDVFDDWVKSHPTAVGLRNKEFPHLDDLMSMWGEDRATGVGAETPADAVEEINLCDEETDTFEREIDEHAKFHKDEEYVREETKKSEMETQDSVCPSNNKATTRKKKKKKSDDALGDLVGEISNSWASTKGRLISTWKKHHVHAFKSRPQNEESMKLKPDFVFYGKYFTIDNRTQMSKEFLELRQGDMTVAEYVKKFERGHYFVPMFARQLAKELKHFIEGLRATIRHDVRLSQATTFREAVDQTLMSERDRNDMIKEAQSKRAGYQGRDQQEPSRKKPAPAPA